MDLNAATIQQVIKSLNVPVQRSRSLFVSNPALLLVADKSPALSIFQLKQYVFNSLAKVPLERQASSLGYILDGKIGYIVIAQGSIIKFFNHNAKQLLEEDTSSVGNISLLGQVSQYLVAVFDNHATFYSFQHMKLQEQAQYSAEQRIVAFEDSPRTECCILLIEAPVLIILNRKLKVLKKMKLNSQGVCMALSEDILLVGHKNGKISCLEVKADSIKVMGSNNNSLMFIKVTPNSIVAARDDSTVQFYSTKIVDVPASPELNLRWKSKLSDRISSIFISDENQIVAVGCSGNIFKINDTEKAIRNLEDQLQNKNIDEVKLKIKDLQTRNQALRQQIDLQKASVEQNKKKVSQLNAKFHLTADNESFQQSLCVYCDKPIEQIVLQFMCKVNFIKEEDIHFRLLKQNQLRSTAIINFDRDFNQAKIRFRTLPGEFSTAKCMAIGKTVPSCASIFQFKVKGLPFHSKMSLEQAASFGQQKFVHSLRVKGNYLRSEVMAWLDSAFNELPKVNDEMIDVSLSCQSYNSKIRCRGGSKQTQFICNNAADLNTIRKIIKTKTKERSLSVSLNWKLANESLQESVLNSAQSLINYEEFKRKLDMLPAVKELSLVDPKFKNSQWASLLQQFSKVNERQKDQKSWVHNYNIQILRKCLTAVYQNKETQIPESAKTNFQLWITPFNSDKIVKLLAVI